MSHQFLGCAGHLPFLALSRQKAASRRLAPTQPPLILPDDWPMATVRNKVSACEVAAHTRPWGLQGGPDTGSAVTNKTFTKKVECGFLQAAGAGAGADVIERGGTMLPASTSWAGVDISTFDIEGRPPPRAPNGYLFPVKLTASTPALLAFSRISAPKAKTQGPSATGV